MSSDHVDRPFDLPTAFAHLFDQARKDVQAVQDAVHEVDLSHLPELSNGIDVSRSPVESAMWQQLEREREERAVSQGHETRRDERPLLSLQEAAKRLNVSPDTLVRMETAEEIQFVRFLDKIVRVAPAEIDRVLSTSEKYHHRRYPLKSRRKTSRR